MATNLLRCVGFTQADALPLYATAGSITFASSYGRDGYPGCRIYKADSDPATWISIRKRSASGLQSDQFAMDEVWVTAYVYLPSLPSSGEAIIVFYNTNASPKIMGEWRVQSDGGVDFYESGGTVLKAQSTATLSAATWHKLDVRIKKETATNNGEYELWIDEVQQYSGNTADTATDSVGEVILGRKVNRGGTAACDLYVDLVGVCDNTGRITGVTHCSRLDPVATGTYTGWTGDETAVDDLATSQPHDGSNYVQSTGVSYETFDLTDSGASTVGIASGDVIHGVEVFTISWKASGVPNVFYLLSITAGGEDYADAATITAAWTNVGKCYKDTNPFGDAVGTKWTKTRVDDLEVGALCGSPFSQYRMSAVGAEVLWSEQVSIAIDPVAIAVDPVAITIMPGAVQAALGALSLSVDAKAITIEPGPSAVGLSIAALSFTLPAITPSGGSTATQLGVLNLGVSLPGITPVGGPVAITLATPNVGIALPQITITVGATSVTLSAVGLSIVLPAITVDAGAVLEVIIALAAIALGVNPKAIAPTGGPSGVSLGAIPLGFDLPNLPVLPGPTSVQLSPVDVGFTLWGLTTVPGDVTIALNPVAVEILARAITLQGGSVGVDADHLAIVPSENRIAIVGAEGTTFIVPQEERDAVVVEQDRDAVAVQEDRDADAGGSP